MVQTVMGEKQPKNYKKFHYRIIKLERGLTCLLILILLHNSWTALFHSSNRQEYLLPIWRSYLFLVIVQNVAPECQSTHCILHKKALESKDMPESL